MRVSFLELMSSSFTSIGFCFFRILALKSISASLILRNENSMSDLVFNYLLEFIFLFFVFYIILLIHSD